MAGDTGEISRNTDISFNDFFIHLILIYVPLL